MVGPKGPNLRSELELNHTPFHLDCGLSILRGFGSQSFTQLFPDTAFTNQQILSILYK